MPRANTKELPSQERLRELFDYDADTGNLIWKVRPVSAFKNQHDCNAWNTNFAGKVAGCITKSTGYRVIRIDDLLYFAHRLIYALHHGVCPSDLQIDHIDGNKPNNRVENLRLATSAENSQNVGKRCNNTSGFTGICWHKHHQKFRASIKINSRDKHLGYFTTAEEAAEAYSTAAIALHGDFVHKSVKNIPPPVNTSRAQLTLWEAA